MFLLLFCISKSWINPESLFKCKMHPWAVSQLLENKKIRFSPFGKQIRFIPWTFPCRNCKTKRKKKAVLFYSCQFNSRLTRWGWGEGRRKKDETLVSLACFCFCFCFLPPSSSPLTKVWLVLRLKITTEAKQIFLDFSCITLLVVYGNKCLEFCIMTDWVVAWFCRIKDHR